MKQQRRQRCKACGKLVWQRFLCLKRRKRLCKSCAHQSWCKDCQSVCVFASKPMKAIKA